MSTYIICSEINRDSLNQYVINASLAGSKLHEEIEFNNNRLLIFNNLQGKAPDTYRVNNNFICVFGCEFGEKNNKDFWIESLLSFDSDKNIESITEFCSTVIIYKNDTLYIYNDSLSCSKTYYSDDFTTFSNSFLSVAHTLVGRLSLNSDSIYEYLINGSLFGEDTFFNEIRAVNHRKYVEIGSTDASLATIPKTTTPNESYTSISSLAELQIDKLKSVFKEYPNNITPNLSFSGGYDSRLLLALLKSENVKPRLFVYGQDASNDVIIAKHISKKENLKLSVINKSEKQQDFSYNESLKDFYAFDGWKVEHGIFDGGVDRRDRLLRNKNNQVSFNGSLGEIYRNFYYTPRSTNSLKKLIHTFYSQYDPKYFTKKFVESNYENIIKEKMINAIDVHDETITRDDIEKLYPYFRGRYWAGRDVRLNNNFGSAFFPFIHKSVINNTDKIPLQFKDLGKLQAEIIKKLDCTLASHQSDYGFNFIQKKPLNYRINYLISVYKPATLRKYSTRFKNLLKKPINTEEELSKYINIVKEISYMSKYVNLSKIKDQRVLGLVVTLEFMFQHFDVTDSE